MIRAIPQFLAPKDTIEALQREIRGRGCEGIVADLGDVSKGGGPLGCAISFARQQLGAANTCLEVGASLAPVKYADTLVLSRFEGTSIDGDSDALQAVGATLVGHKALGEQFELVATSLPFYSVPCRGESAAIGVCEVFRRRSHGEPP